MKALQVIRHGLLLPLLPLQFDDCVSVVAKLTHSSKFILSFTDISDFDKLGGSIRIIKKKRRGSLFHGFFS